MDYGDLEVPGFTTPFVHPMKLTTSDWVDNMKIWPRTEAPQVVSYLVESKACDLKEMKAYKSLDSYNQLQSGWVGQVVVHKPSEEIIFLKGDVVPSQSISKDAHIAWVCVKMEGEVLTGGCSCMAGLGHVCSHVGAILWKIDLANRLGLTGVSCTDESALWNRGTKRNLTPALIENISFKKPKVTSTEIEPEQGTIKNFHNIQQFYSHKELLNFINTSGLDSLFNTPGTIFNSLKTNIHPVEHEIEELVEEEHSHSTIDGLPNDCSLCYSFYNKFILLSQEKKEHLEKSTLVQASELWRESRRLRVTASTASKVPKRETTDPAKFLKTKLYGTFCGNKHTRRGNMLEPIARKRFQEITSFSVVETGSVIHVTEHWLSASPDGLIGEDNILEIKCPDSTNFNLKKVDIVQEQAGLVLNPKGSNGYYTQVQLIMHCTARSNCFFYVYLGGTTDILITCEYNAQFVDSLLLRLRKFYFVYLLPKLVEDYKNGTLKINLTYLKFLNG